MRTLRLSFFCSLLVCCFFCNTIFSQVSGYKGKRLSVGYGFYASPGFVGSRGNTAVNMLHEGY